MHLRKWAAKKMREKLKSKQRVNLNVKTKVKRLWNSVALMCDVRLTESGCYSALHRLKMKKKNVKFEISIQRLFFMCNTICNQGIRILYKIYAATCRSKWAFKTRTHTHAGTLAPDRKKVGFIQFIRTHIFNAVRLCIVLTKTENTTKQSAKQNKTKRNKSQAISHHITSRITLRIACQWINIIYVKALSDFFLWWNGLSQCRFTLHTICAAVAVDLCCSDLIFFCSFMQCSASVFTAHIYLSGFFFSFVTLGRSIFHSLSLNLSLSAISISNTLNNWQC